MRTKLILLLLLIAQVALAQDKKHNYVKETLFLDGGSSAISNHFSNVIIIKIDVQ